MSANLLSFISISKLSSRDVLSLGLTVEVFHRKIVQQCCEKMLRFDDPFTECCMLEHGVLSFDYGKF